MTEPYEPPQEMQGDPHLHSLRTCLPTTYRPAMDRLDMSRTSSSTLKPGPSAIWPDTVNWWPGKKVLVAATWIEYVDWAESLVHVDLSRDQVKGSPEFDTTAPVNRAYESRLYDYYGRPVYWS